MFFWVWIIGLLAFSAVGAVRTKTAPVDQYATFIYVCAVWWASIPIVTGDWLWSLLFLPAGLVVARLMIRRRATSRVTPPDDPRAI
jgi:hypothetical protein